MSSPKAVRFANDDEQIDLASQFSDPHSPAASSSHPGSPYVSGGPLYHGVPAYTGYGGYGTPYPAMSVIPLNSPPSFALPTPPFSLSSQGAPPTQTPLAPSNPPLPPQSRGFSPLNPALAYSRSRNGIAFNLSLPVASQHNDPAFLSQPATMLPRTMRILHPNLPFAIIVDPTGGRSHVTIWDVLDRLHNSLQTTISPTEEANCRTQRGEAAFGLIMRTWEGRDPYRSDRIRRLDFLLGNNRVAGLELLDGKENVWRMHVTP